MPGGGHLRLIVEDAAEMPLVGENLVLLRQERAAGIDHVDAGQIVLPRDILGAKMLLHRHRIIGAALDGRIIGDDHAFAPRDPADAGDDARRMHVAAIQAVGGERRQFEKRRSRIDQEIDALARQHLAARGVPGARRLAAAAGHLIELLRGVPRPARAWLRRCGQNRTRWGRCWNEAAWPSAVYGAPQFPQGGSASWCHCAAVLGNPELSVPRPCHEVFSAVCDPQGVEGSMGPRFNGSKVRRAGMQNCRHRRLAGGPAAFGSMT